MRKNDEYMESEGELEWLGCIKGVGSGIMVSTEGVMVS